MNALTLPLAVQGVFFMALVIFLTRLFSFVLFSRGDPPEIFRYAGRLLPSLVMAVLIVYCLKDVDFGTFPWGLPALGALGFTALTYLWKGNGFISIFGGTIIYMFLT